MVDIDYYKVLNIPRDSSDVEIKKAFRKQALKFHPDRNKDRCANNRFQQINEAFETLGDKSKRNQYDQRHHKNISCGLDFDPIFAEQLFNQFFSDHTTPLSSFDNYPAQSSLRNTRTSIDMSFDDLFNLSEKPTSHKRALPNSYTNTCKKTKTDVDCKTNLFQPFGFETYQTKGDNLHTTIKLSLAEALTGFKKIVQTSDGQSFLIQNDRSVIQSGQQVTYLGRGLFNNTTGKKGNLVVQFIVELPVSLTDEQRIAILDIFPTKS